MKFCAYRTFEGPSGRIGERCDVHIDHEGMFVTLAYGQYTDLLSCSPAEAKALAAALVHYAERAQTVRDRNDTHES